jgi:prophage antirepressor-like protein
MKTLEKAFNGKQVRVIVQKGVEWFAARDVCEILGIVQASSTMRDFPDKEKGVHSIHTPGGEQKMLFINEPGLYRLIFKSRKPEAEAFKAWVFEEVLPAIRKTGKYDVRDIKAKSAENRSQITDQWKRQGVNKPADYAALTTEEYKQLYDDEKIRKKDMDRNQMLKLSAFEAVEAWKLAVQPEEALGFGGCKASIGETAGLLEAVRNQPPGLLKAAG